MIEIYKKLLNDDKKIWTSMIAVITKVEWNVDYNDMRDWIKTMENWKDGLRKEFIKHYGEDATPTVMSISYDLTREKRKETIRGTPQNNLMVEELWNVY